MKVLSVVTTRAGGPEVLELKTAEVSRDTNMALVRVAAASVGNAEIDMMHGRFYKQPRFPFVGGYDLVGTVVDGPADLVGTTVAAMPRLGAWASHVQLPAADLVAVPDGLSPAAAVALVTNGVTAWQMVHRVARVRSGQTVLVQGAAGAVGSLLCVFAAAAGARMIGTASPARHDEVRALGAHPIDYRDNVAAAVRAIAPAGVDAVFDHRAGAGLATLFGLLGRDGTLVAYGADADTGSGPPLRPYLRMLAWFGLHDLRRVLGVGRGRRGRLYNVTPDRRFRADLATVLALAATGGITVPVSTYPLADAARAVRDRLDGTSTGKQVLLMPDV
ncbi:Quinone oxidoreductase [Alloactinosynnema sp. L-07]|uniref:zinc-binding dehydrogenase n=1 Tax=Alloactinosynnema sp. L-07 TaxID=1653480 RepID=UPI00065F096F|nr:zinc-binding dehydrogenase [Alloactinosynnema sp. L-07]CRK60220.1 Quinone oxidoreductase [Alloactinosynnema sp. L-07]